jgi:hypothetical protein
VKEVPPAEAFAGKAWTFRHWVERDATARFARLAGRLARIGTPAGLVKLYESASADEARHVGFSTEQASRYGIQVDPAPIVPTEITPDGSLRQRAIYEVMATTVAETESTAMLTQLMAATPSARMKRLLREFAKDEVKHAQMGWAVLACHKDAKGGIGFLSRWIPVMLQTTAGESLRPPAPWMHEKALLEHGVLPYEDRQKLFVATLCDVVFPGLESLGVDAKGSREWLDRSMKQLGAAREMVGSG